MSNQIMKHCRACARKTLHVAPSTSHVLHLIMTLITFGFWLIIWLFMAIQNKSAAQCTQCGKTKGVIG